MPPGHERPATQRLPYRLALIYSNDVIVDGRALASGPDSVGSLLLAAHEDQWFERKSVRIEPRRLAESLIAFANADGGVIVVGLSNGVVEGTRKNRHRAALMQAAIDFTQPVVAAKATLYACQNAHGASDDWCSRRRPAVACTPPSRTRYCFAAATSLAA